MKKSELRQIIKEEIKKLNEKNQRMIDVMSKAIIKSIDNDKIGKVNPKEWDLKYFKEIVDEVSNANYGIDDMSREYKEEYKEVVKYLKNHYK